MLKIFSALETNEEWYSAKAMTIDGRELMRQKTTSKTIANNIEKRIKQYYGGIRKPEGIYETDEGDARKVHKE